MTKPVLSIVMPYYRNPGMLARQFQVWRHEWPHELKRQVDIVIVDDGSPEPADGVPIPNNYAGYSAAMPDVSIFRVKEDRPWHQHGARNLGAKVAAGRWLFMTDIDHVIPPQTLEAALAFCRCADRRDVMRFPRRDAPPGAWRAEDFEAMAPTTRPDGSLKPHVNSFVVSRAHYWGIGGYDEDYCGIYGTDRLFRDRLFGASVVCDSAAPLIRVSRDVIADASTRGLARKEGRPAGAKKEIQRRKEAEGRADEITVLNFEWERVL